MSGSGLFSNKKPVIAHNESGHGVKGEVGDLRADITAALASLATFTVDEFTNPPAAAAASLLAATASATTAVTIQQAGLLSAGLNVLKAVPRQVTFTTAGGTPANAPPTAAITGSRAGVTQTETVNVPSTATTASSVKFYDHITSIVFAPGAGTAATVSIGNGAALGLGRTPKTRAGLAGFSREISSGALVTTGTMDAVNRGYTPAAAPDGTKSYAVYYEYDPLVGS